MRGSAYPDLGVIQAVVPENSESEVRRVLPHEISHQLLYQATANPFTVTATWIDEGLAVVGQTGGKDFYRDVVADAYNDDELLSLRGLISAFPFDPARCTQGVRAELLGDLVRLDPLGSGGRSAMHSKGIGGK